MKHWVSGAIALLIFGLFLLTLRPGVLPADSGEFQWVAFQLGVAHPPGFPLYTLLAHSFTYLPGDPARNVNLFSAITSALTLYLFGLTLYKIISIENRKAVDLPTLFALLLSLFFLGTSTTYWAQATTANIRSLTTLFAASWFLVVLEFELGDKRDKWRPLFLFVLLLSLGVSHHLSLLFLGAVMGMLILVKTWPLFKSWLVWLSLIGAALLGLIPWLYLPLREPNLREPVSFLRYVLGLDFSSDFFFVATWPQLVERAGVMFNVLTFQFSILLLCLALLGWVFILIRRPWFGTVLGGTFLIHTVIAATYRAPQTVEYMLPAYLPIMLCFGYGIWAILVEGLTYLERGLSRYGVRSSVRSIGSVGAALGVVVLLGWSQVRIGTQNWASYRALAVQHDTLDVVSNWLNDVPEDGLILADWHWFTPLNYVQAVDNSRPDIKVDYRPGRDWEVEITEALADGQSVLSTHFEPEVFVGLPAALASGEGWLYPAEPTNEQELNYSPINFFLGEMLQTKGYRLSRDSIAAGEQFSLQVAWEPTAAEIPPMTLFVHFVGSDGQIYAQADISAQKQPNGLSITRFSLTPRPGVPLGQADLMIGGYLADGTPLMSQAGEARITLLSMEVTGSTWPPYTENRTRGETNDLGWVKYGTDWDRTMPGSVRQYVHWRLPDGSYWTEVLDYPAAGGDHPIQTYIPFGQGIVWTGSAPPFAEQSLVKGETLASSQRFVSSRPVLRDIGVAVRLIGLEEDDFTWAWLNPDPDNDIPATGAIPTLKWVVGSEVYHPRRLTIPSEASEGQRVEGFMRLYDVFTREPVPILDERITSSGRPWVVFDAGTIVIDD